MIKLAPIADAILREHRTERTNEGRAAAGPPPQPTPPPDEVVREMQAALDRKTGVIARRRNESVELRLHKSNATTPVYGIVLLTPDVNSIQWALTYGDDAEAIREFHQFVDGLAGPGWGRV